MQKDLIKLLIVNNHPSHTPHRFVFFPLFHSQYTDILSEKQQQKTCKVRNVRCKIKKCNFFKLLH